jgi:hypothetical protein
MSRIALLGGLLATLPAATTASASAPPSSSFPISGGGFQLTFVGQFSPTAFTTERGLVLLEGTLAGTVTRDEGRTQTVTGVAARLPLRSVQATCRPPTLTTVTAPTATLVPGAEPSPDDDIILEGVTLTRPVDPADTGAVPQVCTLASMLEAHPTSPNPNWASKVAKALNDLGGSWKLVATQPTAPLAN